MTDKLREAAQQALEALEEVDGPITALLGNLLGSPDESAPGTKVRASITALRAALAQQAEPVQEPSYERGFLDGMQKQAESSVDRAVNRMALLAQERATPVKPAPPGLVGVVPITTVSSVSVTTQHRVLTDADLDAIRKIVREGGKE